MFSLLEVNFMEDVESSSYLSCIDEGQLIDKLWVAIKYTGTESLKYVGAEC